MSDNQKIAANFRRSAPIKHERIRANTLKFARGYVIMNSEQCPNPKCKKFYDGISCDHCPDSSSGSEESGSAEKPTVSNSKLQSAIDDLYSGQGSKGQIGNGTMMDAVRNEIKTGNPTKGKYHSEKARSSIKNLEKQLSSGKLDKQEKKIVRELVKDLRSALSGN